jgi:hypothetical protein
MRSWGLGTKLNLEGERGSAVEGAAMMDRLKSKLCCRSSSFCFQTRATASLPTSSI